MAALKVCHQVVGTVTHPQVRFFLPFLKMYIMRMSVLPACTCTTHKPMDGSEAPYECWELSSVHLASALSLRDISPAPGNGLSGTDSWRGFLQVRSPGRGFPGVHEE